MTLRLVFNPEISIHASYEMLKPVSIIQSKPFQKDRECSFLLAAKALY